VIGNFLKLYQAQDNFFQEIGRPLEAKLDDIKGLAENVGLVKGHSELGIFKGAQQKISESLELSAGTIGLTAWTNAFNMAMTTQMLKTQRDQTRSLDNIDNT
jgi:hypothetical protein